MLDPAEFIQTHKSYVVALRAIRYVGNQEVVLQELQPRIPFIPPKTAGGKESVYGIY